MVDIPVELFFGFIGMSVVLLVIGLIREPKIPATVVFAGMFMLTITMVTDNITFGSRIDNIVATESTFNITGSVTEIPDYKYNVITGTQALVIRVDGSNVHSRVEYITPTSVLIDEEIECISVPLRRTGSPTGVVQSGILDSNGAMVKTFDGIVNPATVLTTFTYYSFCLPDGQSYIIQSGDRIGVLWVSGTSDGTNFLETIRDTSNVFDGTNTVSSAYTTLWTDTTTADMNMQLYSREEIPDNIQVSGIGGIYSYEPDSFQFTELPKVIFAFFSVVLMLLGALLTKMGMG
jgi:hypothetical protein